MSRSGYNDDCDGWALIRWRGAVNSAINGKRGQAFLRELVAALDAAYDDFLAYATAFAATHPTAPAAALTDEQIEEIYQREFNGFTAVRMAPKAPPLVFKFARAIIAASKES